jgi:hypothetical protein
LHYQFADIKVQRIIYLTKMMDCLPDSFNNAATIIRLHIKAANSIPMIVNRAANIAPKAQKCRPPSPKGLHPRQKQKAIVIPATISLARDQDNTEISIHYMHTRKT